jgi:hypothetical protein
MTVSGVQLIVSVATSGVVSAIVAHMLSTGRAEKEFRRKKLEELFMAVHTDCTKLFSTNLIWPRVMRGEITYDEGNDLLIKNLSDRDKSADIALMLINICFPDLRPSFQTMLQRRDQISQIHSEFKKAYQRGENCDAFVKPFLEQLKMIDTDETALTDRLFRICEKYN